MFDLTGRVALVTGASRGIGRACALALARSGADVAVHYNSDHEAALETAAAVEASGRRSCVLQADARDTAGFAALWPHAEKELGAPSILVNNAGVFKPSLLATMSEATWDDTLAVDLKSAFLLTKAATRSMMRARAGRIINIASQAAQSGEPLGAHYCAAKAGLLGLTRATARELAPYGVTCNAIAPGWIETDLTAGEAPERRERKRVLVPLGRYGSAHEVGALCLFLASDEAAYITGQTISIDGGLRPS